jgi:hypothetical protein
MEPMVVCALGIAVYFGYLTVRDIFTDLQREGIFANLAGKKNREIFSRGILLKGRRLRSFGDLMSADFGLVSSRNSARSVSRNLWGGDLMEGYYGFHANGRRSRV